MFELLKKKAREKIEKNSVKSELSWIDKNGELQVESVILKRSKIPILGDWGRIYPPVNEDGSWNLINLLFGGSKNLIKLMIIGGLVALVLMGYYELFGIIERLNENCMPLIR